MPRECKQTCISSFFFFFFSIFKIKLNVYFFSSLGRFSKLDIEYAQQSCKNDIENIIDLANQACEIPFSNLNNIPFFIFLLSNATFVNNGATKLKIKALIRSLELFASENLVIFGCNLFDLVEKNNEQLEFVDKTGTFREGEVYILGNELLLFSKSNHIKLTFDLKKSKISFSMHWNDPRLAPTDKDKSINKSKSIHEKKNSSTPQPSSSSSAAPSIINPAKGFKLIRFKTENFLNKIVNLVSPLQVSRTKVKNEVEIFLDKLFGTSKPNATSSLFNNSSNLASPSLGNIDSVTSNPLPPSPRSPDEKKLFCFLTKERIVQRDAIWHYLIHDRSKVYLENDEYKKLIAEKLEISKPKSNNLEKNKQEQERLNKLAEAARKEQKEEEMDDSDEESDDDDDDNDENNNNNNKIDSRKGASTIKVIKQTKKMEKDMNSRKMPI